MSHKPRLTPMTDEVTLLSITGSQYLSDKISTAYGQKLGELMVSTLATPARTGKTNPASPSVPN